jgi:YcxB-like protein
MTDQAALLELDVQLEFGDYLRYQYYISLRVGWWLIPLFVLASGFSVVVITISAFYQDSYLLRDIIPFASMVFLGGIFMFAAPYLTAKREYEVNPGLRQMIRYQVHEEYLAVTSTRRQGKLPWDKVREARETGSSFLIYVEGSGRAFILPKHEFPGETEILAMRELLTVILGARKCHFRLGRVSSLF